MKVKFGGGVADGRGSIGGTTYSRNRYGSYARQRVTPVNPRTPAQIRARSNFQSAATAWRSLTPVQRTQWDNYAAATPIIDSLGNTIYYTGMQAYMAVTGIYRTCQSVQSAVNIAVIPPVPTVSGGTQADDITSFAMLADTTPALEDEALTIAVASVGLEGDTVGEAGVIFLSRPVPATTRFFAGPWIATPKAFQSGADPTTTVSFSMAELAALGIVPTPGARVFAKIVRFSAIQTRIPAIRTSSVVFA